MALIALQLRYLHLHLQWRQVPADCWRPQHLVLPQHGTPRSAGELCRHQHRQRRWQRQQGQGQGGGSWYRGRVCADEPAQQQAGRAPGGLAASSRAGQPRHVHQAAAAGACE